MIDKRHCASRGLFLALIVIIGVREANCERQYKGRYTNVDYGFTVVIPAGMIGLGTPPPAPNHGFRILFSRNGHTDSIGVQAMYDVLEPPGTSSGIGGQVGQPGSAEHRPTLLGGLRADMVLRKFPSGRVYEAITARRPEPNSYPPIQYTVYLDADEDHYAATERAFRELVRSFRLLPMRAERLQ